MQRKVALIERLVSFEQWKKRTENRKKHPKNLRKTQRSEHQQQQQQQSNIINNGREKINERRNGLCSSAYDIKR